MTTISTVIQQTNLDQVGSVVITPVTLDPTSGEYVRQIRVYTPPDVTTGIVVLAFTLQVSAAAESNIELTAPAALF
jgi:hypothetical protein